MLRQATTLGLVLVAVAAGASCSADPGADDPPSAAERYESWIGEWAAPTDAWSQVWVAAVKDLDAADGAVGVDELHELGGTYAGVSQDLRSALMKAGRPESPPAPVTYYDALLWTIDEVLDDASAAQQCEAEGCVEPTVALFRSTTSLEQLLVKTAAVELHPETGSRTVDIGEAALAESDVGGKIIPDITPEPLRYLCVPDFEPASAAASSKAPSAAEVEQTAFQTSYGALLLSVQRWKLPEDAFSYFQTASIRSLTCPLVAPEKAEGSTTSWSDETARSVGGIPTLAWRYTNEQPGKDIHGLGLGAIVDDTVIEMLALSTGELSQDDAEQLLQRQIEQLGVVVPEDGGSSSAPD